MCCFFWQNPEANDGFRIPAFVPKIYRFSCGAEGCNYITHDSVGLKKHFETLHAEMEKFRYFFMHINLALSKCVWKWPQYRNSAIEYYHCLLFLVLIAVRIVDRRSHSPKSTYISGITTPNSFSVVIVTSFTTRGKTFSTSFVFNMKGLSINPPQTQVA